MTGPDESESDTPSRLARALFANGLTTLAIRNLTDLDGRIAYAEAKGVPSADKLVPAASGLLLGGSLGIVGEGPELERLQTGAQGLDHADRVSFLGFLDEYEDVLGHMRAAEVFASPSTREGFGITYAEAMAADCTVIGAQHPESAASEVIGDAGFLAQPTVDSVRESLERALAGGEPATDPQERAKQFDWDSVAEQAEEAYERTVDGSW